MQVSDAKKCGGKGREEGWLGHNDLHSVRDWGRSQATKRTSGQGITLPNGFSEVLP